MTFSESDFGIFSESTIASDLAGCCRLHAHWNFISEFGEWRFERKCFRANIETSAAKTRRSRIIFLLISVGEEFVVFHLLHFYTEDRSFAEVRTSIYGKMTPFFLKR